MSAWSTTLTSIKRRVETLAFRLNGKERLTHEEKLIIAEALDVVITDLATERSVDIQAFISDTTLTCTVGTNYVDLAANVIAVIDGTVRIPTEETVLGDITIEDFCRIDPGEEVTGRPAGYAVASSGDADVLRVYLRPIPDQAYVLALKVKAMPESGDASVLPDYMHGLLQSGVMAEALTNLGFYREGEVHRVKYQERLKNVRQLADGTTGPRQVRRGGPIGYHRSAQERAGV